MASTVNYVKFLRGTPTAYNKLTKKDPDTLYFISNKNASIGTLYLGDKIIIGGEALANSTLKDLEDIFLSEYIPTNSILVYDFDSRRWINKPFLDLYSELVEEMKGASVTKDGKSGLVPAPKRGEQNLFLRGDGTWVNPNISTSQDYSQLKNILTTLLDVDSLEKAPKQSIKEISVGVLQEQLIPSNSREDLNSLQKIAKALQKQPVINSDFDAKIKVLENKSIIVDSKIANLENAIFDISALKSITGKHTTEIKELQERLNWKEFDIETF